MLKLRNQNKPKCNKAKSNCYFSNLNQILKEPVFQFGSSCSFNEGGKAGQGRSSNTWICCSSSHCCEQCCQERLPLTIAGTILHNPLTDFWQVELWPFYQAQVTANFTGASSQYCLLVSSHSFILFVYFIFWTCPCVCI